MRVAYPHLLFALLPLIDCGSESDLLIGIVPLSEAGTATTAAGTGAAPATGGSEAVAGVGGSGAASGSSEGGSSSNAAGAAGAAGDTNEPCIAGELPPDGSLVHRYSFDGTGTKAIDSIAGSDGDIINASLDGSHALTLSGDSAEYVNLPDKIISTLPDVTVVVWTAWIDGAAYGRVFDFGMNDQGVDKTGMGNSYMAVLPKTGFFNQTKPGLGGEIKVPGFPTVTLGSTVSMAHRAAQIALTLQGGVRAALYLDGDELASQATAITPAKIDDRNNWIGKSQYTGNPGYEGSFEELRIYDVALDSCQLHTLLVHGPESL
jgi:hypothetical protein